MEFVEDVVDFEFSLGSKADFLLVVFVLLVDHFDPRSCRVHCKINYIIGKTELMLRLSQLIYVIKGMHEG